MNLFASFGLLSYYVTLLICIALITFLPYLYIVYPESSSVSNNLKQTLHLNLNIAFLHHVKICLFLS